MGKLIVNVSDIVLSFENLRVTLPEMSRSSLQLNKCTSIMARTTLYAAALLLPLTLYLSNAGAGEWFTVISVCIMCISAAQHAITKDSVTANTRMYM